MLMYPGDFELLVFTIRSVFRLSLRFYYFRLDIRIVLSVLYFYNCSDSMVFFVFHFITSLSNDYFADVNLPLIK
jgi:hypothetical protein